jgi:hypothetical protein
MVRAAALVALTACVVGDTDDASPPPTAVAYPACSGAAADPDGDGWGWEPARSCVVAGVEVPGGDGAPACSPSATDPDGDGWGWSSARADAGTPPSSGLAAPTSTAPASAGRLRGSPTTAARRGQARSGRRCNAVTAAGADGMPAAAAAVRRAEATCRVDPPWRWRCKSPTATIDAAGQLPYDATKDGNTDGSQNVCVFNLNIDFIRRSCRTDCDRFQDFANRDEKRYLNRRASLGECVRRLAEGFDRFGVAGALYFHRGGASGWASPGADERAFAAAQLEAADHLRDVPDRRTNGDRVAASIVHRKPR